ncbi:MAG: S8 family serine peptidase, partial [Ginsengibacter sp.]
KIKEPVALSWEEADTTTVLKRPFDTTRFTGAVQGWNYVIEHESMSVELMLKGNPGVHFMALNQHAYDREDFSSLFTSDIAHNQHVADSLVDLLINSFQEMAAYCNRYKVRVVVITGMLRGKDFYFTDCGHDSTEAKAFGKKMENKFKNGYAIAYSEAPNTLYINSAGNLNLDIDIDSVREMISFLHLPNIIIAGALYKDLHRSYDSNYGSKVDVLAPAHFPLRVAKFNYRWGQSTESAGTSAAAPVIANLAIQILELNPNLTAAQVKQLIIEGADKEPYEKGINIINPKKTIALLKQGCCF